MNGASPNTRRWIRHDVNLPVRVFARGLSQAIPGKGTELSAGGMALYAGLEVKASQTLEVEFVAGSRARVAGVVRNRQGYCFGLEFVTPLTLEGEGSADSTRPGAQFQLEPGPLSPRANELFQKIKVGRGNAGAYALLAQVLGLAGRRSEARDAADRALTYFRYDNQTRTRERNDRFREMMSQIQTLRNLMLLVVEGCDRGNMDPRLPALIAELRKLLGNQ